MIMWCVVILLSGFVIAIFGCQIID